MFRWRGKVRYERTLANIARLEFELGLSNVRPPRKGGRIRTAQQAAQEWAEGAADKAANYEAGIRSAAGQV